MSSLHDVRYKVSDSLSLAPHKCMLATNPACIAMLPQGLFFYLFPLFWHLPSINYPLFRNSSQSIIFYNFFQKKRRIKKRNLFNKRIVGETCKSSCIERGCLWRFPGGLWFWNGLVWGWSLFLLRGIQLKCLMHLRF